MAKPRVTVPPTDDQQNDLLDASQRDAESAALTQEKADAEQETGLTDGEPAAGEDPSTRNPADQLPGGATRALQPPDLNWIEAITRYINLVNNDVGHGTALAAAQHIDDDFHVTADHHARLRRALGKEGEPFRFAESKPKNKGVMVCLVPPTPICESLAELGTEPPEQIHLTLAFLGSVDDVEEDVLLSAVRAFAATERPLVLSTSGNGRFVGSADGKDAWYASVDGPALPDFRHRLLKELRRQGLEPSQKHGFSPHMTLSYLGKDDDTPADRVSELVWTSEQVVAVWGDNWHAIRLPLPMAEAGPRPLAMANINPPDYVLNLYDKWEMTDDDAASLADYIFGLRRDGYLLGINDQLVQLGADRVEALDRALLARLHESAAASADGIRETYNRDLTNELYTSYVELRADLGRQTSTYQLNAALDRWFADRAEWKAEQIAGAELNAAYNDGADAFVRNNSPIAVSGQIVPDEAQCEDCQDLVDMGEMSVAQLLEIETPLHPGCEHEKQYNYEDVEDTGGLWDGSEGSGARGSDVRSGDTPDWYEPSMLDDALAEAG